MESVHTEETQHNALSIDNIMLNWDAKFNVKSGVLIGEPLREHEKMLCKFAQLIKTAWWIEDIHQSLSFCDLLLMHSVVKGLTLIWF